MKYFLVLLNSYCLLVLPIGIWSFLNVIALFLLVVSIAFDLGDKGGIK